MLQSCSRKVIMRVISMKKLLQAEFHFSDSNFIKNKKKTNPVFYLEYAFSPVCFY